MSDARSELNQCAAASELIFDHKHGYMPGNVPLAEVCTRVYGLVDSLSMLMGEGSIEISMGDVAHVIDQIRDTVRGTMLEERRKKLTVMGLKELGLHLINEHMHSNKVAQETTRNYLSVWSLAMSVMGSKTYENYDHDLNFAPKSDLSDKLFATKLERGLLLFCAGHKTWAPSTLLTNSRCLYDIGTKLMGCDMPEFFKYVMNLKNVNNMNHYQRMSDEELEKELLDESGKFLLTTKVLQERTLSMKNNVLDFTTESPVLEKQLFFNLLLTLHAWMGQRPQDYAIAYTEEYATEDKNGGLAWYDPEKRQMHFLNFGKTKKAYPRRVVDVPLEVVAAISTYHKYHSLHLGEQTHLLPLLQNYKSPVDGIRKFLKVALKQLGLPSVSSNVLRHLFETHCLYYKNMSPFEFGRVMSGIGHSVGVSTKVYSQRYRGLINHKLGYGLCQEDLLDEVKNLGIDDPDKQEKDP